MRGVDRVWLGVLMIFAVVLAGCGSSARSPKSHAAAAALERAGWKVQTVVGMPQTLSGATQVLYLQTVAPDGAHIGLQFFSSAKHAVVEKLDAERRLHRSNVTTVGSAFVLGEGTTPLPPVDVRALRRLRP